MYERMPAVHRLDDVVAATESPAPAAVDRGSYVVGSAHDAAERRADQVADRGLAVLLGSGGAGLATATVPSRGGSRIRRSSVPATIGLAGGPTDAGLSAEIDSARGGGRSVEPDVRTKVQSALGHDVGDVRIHTDARADSIAQRIQASAFTVGSDVFFAAGQYRPDTSDGMRTLLHETAHTMESGSHVQRAVRRKVSVTPDQFDGSFPKEGGLAGIRKALSSDEIPKIRDALKRYHAAAPGDKKQLDALQLLVKYTDMWLKKHAQPKDAAERAKIDVVDSIRVEAGVDFAKIQAGAIYMRDGGIAAENRSKSASDKVTPQGSHPLQNLQHTDAFADSTPYENRASVKGGTMGGGAKKSRDKLVATGELAAHDPAKVKELSDALTSLSPAEFAAIHTYTGSDYGYINPNVGGWGKGKFDMGPGKEAEGAANKIKYEEAGLHGGFIAEAMRKLPIWKGTTYKGMTMNTDYLGLTTASAYKANDFWSTSEARSISEHFLTVSAAMSAAKNQKVTMAAICTIKVTNGRDVSRISNSPEELEILLPPGSIYKIGAKNCYIRGKDDATIQAKFGKTFFDSYKDVTEFWLIDLTQQFSDDKDVVGAYQNPDVWKSGDKSKAGPRNYAAPWAGFSTKRVIGKG